MRRIVRSLTWIAAALVLGACTQDQTGQQQLEVNSCDGASLDSTGRCRTPAGQFAPTSCCQYGALPTDLQVISNRFEALVVPEFEQEESTFEMERFRFASSEYLVEVSVAEAKRAASGDWTTQQLIVSDLSEMIPTQLAVLEKQVFSYYGAYFCGTFHELADLDVPDYGERCRELTGELFAELNTYPASLGAYTATIEACGDFAYLRLYIVSAIDRTQALVFDFDLIHEI